MVDMKDNNVSPFRKRPANDYKGPPLINLPPVTKVMLGVLLVVHVGLMIPGIPAGVIISQLGFVPARFTALLSGVGFDPAVLWSPVTYALVHQGWVHLLMNMAMMAAFGAGLERVMRPARYIELTLLGCLFGVVGQMVVYPMGTALMIGASGAISAQFAAILLVMQRQNRLPIGRYGILPFAAFWVGISVMFAAMNGFAEGGVAWAAHLGGFLGAMALLRYKKGRYL